METTLVVLRWIGLLVALGLTVVVLKEVVLVLRTLSHIHSLAVHIRDASRSLAGRLALAEGLQDALAAPVAALAAPGERIRRSAASLSSGAARKSGPNAPDPDVR